MRVQGLRTSAPDLNTEAPRKEARGLASYDFHDFNDFRQLICARRNNRFTHILPGTETHENP